MTTLSEFRQQYPQYGDKSDDELADALHRKHYADMPREEFNRLIGYRPTVAQGALGAVGHGLASGAEGLVSLPGGLASLAVSGVEKAAGALGASPETQERIAKARDYIPLATSAQVAHTVEGLTGYRPLSEEERQALPTGEKYLYAGSEMVPGAALFGIPGGIKQMAATGLKYGFLPGLGGEAVVQATGAEGTPDEWWIRTLGSIGTGLGVAGAGAMGKWAMLPKEPNIQAIAFKGRQLEAAAQRAYQMVDQSGMKIDPLSLQALNTRIGAVLSAKGYDVANLPAETKRALAMVGSLANEPRSFTYLDNVRKAVRDAFDTGMPVTRLLARDMTSQIDDYIAKLNSADIVGGQAPRAAQQALLQARDLWGRSARFQNKAEIIGNIWEAALDANKANYTKAGIQTAVRQGFRALNARIRKDPDLARQFSATERLAINDVVRGGPIENVLRRLGSFAPVSPSAAAFSMGSTGPVGAGLGYLASGTPEGAAIGSLLGPAASVLIGAPARAASNVAQRRMIDALIGNVLNEGRPFKMPPTSSFNPGMLVTYGQAARRAPTAEELAQALAAPSP